MTKTERTGTPEEKLARALTGLDWETQFCERMDAAQRSARSRKGWETRRAKRRAQMDARRKRLGLPPLDREAIRKEVEAALA